MHRHRKTPGAAVTAPQTWRVEPGANVHLPPAAGPAAALAQEACYYL